MTHLDGAHLLRERAVPTKLLLLLLLLQSVAITVATASADPPSRHPQQPGYQLEPPASGREQFVFGPGLDLVALNRRRFELEHEHASASDASQLRRAELIESNLAALPDQLLASLPEDVSRQVLETLATDPALIMGHRDAGGPADSLLASAVKDPEAASIERLTKSCLTVHASSARPEELNVTFHLYTRKNPEAPYIFQPQVSRLQLLQGSPFDPRRPIKWITHGFHTNVDKSEWMLEAKSKILAYEDANVFLTDWRRGASPALAFYPKAAVNAHVVAKLIVKILRRLQADIELHKVHLIGHSLGAHIMGFVGSAFTEDYLSQQQQVLMQIAAELGPHMSAKAAAEHLTRRQQRAPDQLIGRISACDPALPCFGPSSSAPNSQQRVPRQGEPASTPDWTPTLWTHLRPDSAVQVEVMHSNPGVMGYAEPLGDYDFYPNGNDRQPGCGDTDQMSSQLARRPKRQLGAMLGSVWSRLSPTVPQPDQAAPRQSGWSDTLNRFIKPIRDFLQSYTCSHHRSVDLMVESMYCELRPREQLDADSCHIIGYRCSDYKSFKRGFCYACQTDDDCRAFAKTSFLPVPTRGRLARRSSDGSLKDGARVDKFVGRALELFASDQLNGTQSNRTKRILPTFNQYEQLYLGPHKNMYFFDTGPAKDFCLYHYHLLIKYRWFKLRESVASESFRLVGSLADLAALEPLAFHRHSQSSYTTLLTERHYLGPIQSLVLLSDSLRPTLIDYIEVTYMSNLDARVRARNSARLCRSPSIGARSTRGASPTPLASQLGVNVFVPCAPA